MRTGEVLEVLRQTAATVQPTECAFDDPALGKDLELLGSVRALHDLEWCAGRTADRRGRLHTLKGAITNHPFQEREETADLMKDRQAGIAVLDIGGHNSGTQHQAQRIDRRIALLALDFLARVIPHRINPGPPFSALLTLWLSMMTVVGLASRPANSRAST